MTNKLFILTLISIVLIDATKDYGYFNFSVNYVKTCQGPKRRDCCVSKLTLFPGSVIDFNMDCKENMSPTKGKIVASAKNRQKVRLQMDKPCKHLFIKPVIMNVFNTSETCVILKNKYHFTLNYAEISQKYYSGMFLYGNWTFQSMFFSEDCNLVCMVLEANIYPKKEQ